MINKIIKKFFYTLIKVSNTRAQCAGRRAQGVGYKTKDKRQKLKHSESTYQLVNVKRQK